MSTLEKPPIDVNPHHFQEVLRILSVYVPQVDVRAFGSRAKWTAKPYSDLDLALMTDSPLNLAAEAQLREAFDESSLPYKVDFVDWAATSQAFREIILRDSILIQTARKKSDAAGWAVVSLEDALDTLLDYRGKTPEKTASGVPLVTAKIVKRGRIEPPNEFIAREKYSAWMTRGLPRKGDVVLTTEAPLGEVAQLESADVALAQRIVVLRGKPGVLDNTYLRYLLQTTELQEQLASRATGTTVLGIKQSELRKIALRLPPIELQCDAARVLSELDDRIALLREANATLEAIAQALFKSWFIDFDPVRAKAEGRPPVGMDEATAALFPDEFEESELGAVPMGWPLRTFRETIDIIGGGTPKTSNTDFWNGTIPWFSVVDAPAPSDIFVIDTEKHITEAGLNGSSTKILPTGTTIISARGTVGRLALTGCPMTMNQSCYGLRGKAQDDYFTFFSTTRLVRQLQQRAHGSVFDTITQETFSGVQLSYPTAQVISAFDSTVAPLMLRVRENLFQTKTLSSIRDALLPRLVYGQLRLTESAKPSVEHA